MGLIENYSKYENNFFVSQLINYDENKTIEHVKENLNENKKIYTIFNSDVDLKQLLTIVKQKIQESAPNDFAIVDKYLVDCEMDIAKFNQKATSHLIAITLPNSKNIINIYPVLISKKEIEKQKQLYKKDH